MKLCKDCRHYSHEDCRHTLSISDVDVVNGFVSYRNARTMRVLSECDKEAKLFEPKPVRIPWLVRIAYRLSK